MATIDHKNFSSENPNHTHQSQNAYDVFFSYGFRPFFLLGAVYAVLVMALFLFWIGIHHAGGDIINMSISLAPHVWHGHEMLFGFTMAVIAGFFLTAVPNWTETRPVQGLPLVALTVTWLLGRLAMGFSDYLSPSIIAVADLLFAPFLGFLVIKALISAESKKNFVFLPILMLLFAANASFHLEQLGLYDDGAALSQRLGLGTIALLLTIVGGRVVPAFTTNALRNQGMESLPVNNLVLNVLGIISVVAFLIADSLAPFDQTLTGSLALIAAITNGVRLILWKGYLTLKQPIVWVLHLGFAWLVIGLGLRAFTDLSDMMSPQTAMHALTAGAIGTMTLAVMSRAALGHTGRAFQVNGFVTLAYMLISVGTLARIIVPTWAPSYYNEGMLFAGICWLTAFSIFTAVYWPILTGPVAKASD